MGAEGIFHQLKQQTEWVSLLTEAYEKRLLATELKRKINQLFDKGQNECIFDADMRSFDKRINHAISLIKQEVFYENGMDLAKSVGLSPQHLRRLFKQSVESTITQYKTHLRMLSIVAIKSCVQNNVMTSAIESGFYDVSHANRVHKSCYGMPLSGTLSVSDIHVDESVLHEDSFISRILATSF